MCVVQTTDGGYALTGYTMSFGAGGWDMWLVKTDIGGNEEWNKTYGGSTGLTRGDEGARWLIQTSDGGYALAGDTWAFAARLADFWLVKTDMNGNEEWNRTYDGKGWDGACSVLQTTEGGYAIVGFTAYGELGPDVDFWFVRTDMNGNQLWAKTYGGTNDEYGRSFVQTSDGGYALAGWTNSFGAGGYDYWLVKTDVNGSQQWAKTYGGSSDDMGYSMVQTSDGGYAMSGYTESFGAGCYLLIKTDSTGNQMWAKTYGRTIRAHPSSMIQTSDGGFAISGYTTTGVGDLNLWMTKTDALGNQEWNLTLGGVDSDNARCVIQTDDNGYALSGDTSLGAGSSDFWLVKLASEHKTWIVDDDEPADFHTIQEAINAASSGDTVFVRNGTYYEHLMINRTIQLVGENNYATIIDGEYKDPPEMVGSVVLVKANNVKISGFTIQHCRAGGNAICLDNYVNMTFSHNIITGNNEGIRILHSSGNVISYNIVQDCYYNTGVGFDWSYNNIVHCNTIMHNHYGLSGGYDNHNNTYSENTIINNDIGFGTNMYDDNFFHNNFVNNSVNVIANGANSWNNSCEGNYWSDYNGTDSDGDGIGNTRYIINENNQDNYPLMNPYWNPGDINHDLKIDGEDIAILCKAFDTKPGDLNWNSHADVNSDSKIDGKDIGLTVKCFDTHYP
jgi:parallel beta-helix repeat protein